MGDQPTQRRLAAVLAADVAGYTRLMEQDTDGTDAKQLKRQINTQWIYPPEADRNALLAAAHIDASPGQ